MLAQLEMLEAEERSVSQELAETEGEAGNIEDENQQLRAQLRLMDREKVSNSASDPYSLNPDAAKNLNPDPEDPWIWIQAIF